MKFQLPLNVLYHFMKFQPNPLNTFGVLHRTSVTDEDHYHIPPLPSAGSWGGGGGEGREKGAWAIIGHWTYYSFSTETSKAKFVKKKVY